MTRRIILSLAVLALAAGPVLAQEGMDHDAAMKAWMEAAKPGPQHKMLTDRAGTWDVVVKSYENPAEPMETKGTAEAKSILGGRFLYEEMTGEMMGMPFGGVGITGYNNSSKKYEMVWMDSMGTMMITGEGTMEGDALTMTMVFPDPMTGKEITSKGITRFMGPDKHVYEMYTMMDGKEVKNMEAVYTRRK